MLTETIVRKPLSIGAHHLSPGDVMSDEVGALLPPGRIKVLKEGGWLSERPTSSGLGFDRLEELVAEQQAQIDSLMERVVTLEARRGPGRPRKET